MIPYVEAPGRLSPQRLHPMSLLAGLAMMTAASLGARGALALLVCVGAPLCAAAVLGGALPVLRRFAPLLLAIGAGGALFWGVYAWLAESRPVPVALAAAVLGGLRLALLTAAGLLFLCFCRVEDLALGLQQAGLPYGAAFAVTLAFRLAPLFLESGSRVIEAQAARGFDPRSGGLLARARHFVPVVVPTLAVGLRRADSLAVALESRGFGRPGRRASRRLRAGAGDLAAGAALAALTWWALSWS